MAEMAAHPELTPLADFLHRAIDRSPKTQRQLAQEIGFTSVNMLAMIKHGTTKFPFDKVVPAAIALEVDVAHLFRLVLEQDWPRRLHLIEVIFNLVASSNERTLIETIRRLTGDGDPRFSEAEIAALVKPHVRSPGVMGSTSS